MIIYMCGTLSICIFRMFNILMTCTKTYLFIFNLINIYASRHVVFAIHHAVNLFTFLLILCVDNFVVSFSMLLLRFSLNSWISAFLTFVSLFVHIGHVDKMLFYEYSD